MKLSARNVINFAVKSLKDGVVNSEVLVELPGGIHLVAIITKASAQNLNLAPGKRVYAVIKASTVMIATE